MDRKISKLEHQKEEYAQDGFYVGKKGPLFGTRHVQILLLSGCLLVGIATRGSFAVQIVAMTDKNSSSPNLNIHTYTNWDHSNIVLSSFYWLYVITNLFSAPLEKKYGPKWFLLSAMFINFIAYMLIPIVAEEFGEIGVLICRLIQGFGEGFMYPTQQIILGSWAPTEERSTALIVVNTGVTIGAMLASIVPGYLSTTSGGWPASFYILGAIGIIWCILFLIFGQDSPASHPRICDEEKKYIQLSLNQHHSVEIPVPYREICTSIAVWAVLIAQIGIAWINNMAYTEYSSFLDKVMNFDIQTNGLFSAVPPGAALLAGFIFGPLSDFIITHNYLSTVNSRRIFHIAGGIGISISIISLAYLKESQKTEAVLLMVIIYVSQAAMVCGNVVNMIDLSPRFAGVIFGISNSAGQSIALFAPICVQYIVTDAENINQWKIVFVLTAVIILSSSVFFLIFASGERQKWDGPGERSLPIKEKQKRVSVISVSENITIIPNI